MRSHRKVSGGLYVTAIVVLGLSVAELNAQTFIVSLDSSGQQGNNHSKHGRSSSDGNLFVFQSQATNLVPGGTNGYWQIFLRDVPHGTTVLVSTSASGQQGNGSSFDPDITDDGMLVVFSSEATNLVAGDTNAVRDIFVKNLVTGTVTRVNVPTGGGQALNAHSFEPSLSADGRCVVFLSNADNLVPGDTNNLTDVFAHDLQTGVTSRVNVSPSGDQANGDTPSGVISRDGRYAAFHSIAHNLLPGGSGCFDVYLKDLQTGALERVSVNSGGVPANDCSWNPAVSWDGEVIAFLSRATNLVDGDTNGVEDVFVHDRLTGETQRVSVRTDGGQANNYSGWSAISGDGLVVTFHSVATNLVNGSFPNNRDYVYAHNRATGETVMASLAADGGVPNDGSGAGGARAVGMSGDGRYAIFDSSASNLVPNDTNGKTDVFVRPLNWQGTAPFIIQHPSDQTVCPGDTASFTVQAGGTPPLTYQWRKDGANVPGATDPTLIIVAAQTGDAGQYTAVVTNPWGTAVSNPGLLTVGSAITKQPEGGVICAGSDLVLRVTATGVPPLSYQWRKNGEIIAGATNNVLVLEHAQPGDSGDYDVLVTSPCGSTASDLAHVVVQPAIVFLQQPQSQFVCEGQPVTLQTVINSDPPYTAYWRHDGTVIPGATELTYSIPAATQADAGVYELFVSNACGLVSAEPATITVGVVPAIDVQPVSATRCQGQTVTFDVTASGSPPLSYQWRHDGADAPGATQHAYTIPAVTPADGGLYDVVITNPCGFVVSAAANLTVTDDVTPTITQQPSDQTVCLGNDAVFTVVATGTDLRYQWQQFIDGQGYVDIPGATQATYIIPAVDMSDNGTTLVVWVSNVCNSVRSNEAVLLVDQGTLAITQQPRDQVGCETGSARFEVLAQGAPSITYQWRKEEVAIPGATQWELTLNPLTPADGGVYDVVVSSACTSITSNPATLTVTPYDPPVIVTYPPDQSVCENSAVVLTVTVGGPGPFSYQWRKDAQDMPGAAGSSYEIASFTRSDVGSYDVVVGNYCSTATSPPARLTISRLPVIDRQPSDRVVATDEAVTLVVEVRGSDLTYQWRKDGTDIPGATSSQYTLDPVQAGDQGQFDVRLQNACGVVLSRPASLTLVEPPRTTLTSLSTIGTQANDHCTEPAISADGRYVAFLSHGTGLFPDGWPDEHYHVMLRDRQSATTWQADASAHGWHTDGDSSVAVMSPNEGWIAYESLAGNIVFGDTNGVADVFLVSVNTGQAVRVSVSKGGVEGNGPSTHASISTNGYYVAFQSDADNLVAADTNGAADVFVYNRQDRTLIRVSVDAAGEQGNGPSRWPAISFDGRLVAFESVASNLVPSDTNGVADIFLYDRDPDGNGVFDEGNATVTRVSAGSGGVQANGASARPAISAGGQYVAFESAADNLVPGDTNGATDVFVMKLSTGAVTLVSRATGGMPGDGESTRASISATGRYLAFLSRAANLVPGDTNGKTDVFLHDRDPDGNGVFDEGNQTTVRVSVSSSGAEANADSAWPMISGDGAFVVFESAASNLDGNDHNGCNDVFLRVVQAGETHRLSVSDAGAEAHGHSRRPFISGGSQGSQFVLFASEADDLIPGDTNEAVDIFSRNIQLNQTRIWSRGWMANADSLDAAVSADGRYVAFESLATNLASGDGPGSDVFVRDMQTGAIELMSVNSAGEPANQPSYDPAISADGRYVVFESFASNLVPGADGGLFVRDRVAGTTALVSITHLGAPSHGASAEISADGRYVAFLSAESDLVLNDTNGKVDIFVRDLVAGTTARVSLASDGTQPNGDCTNPAISGDGRYVSFVTPASNLVPGDTNGAPDVFRHDRQTGQTALVSATRDGHVGNDGNGRVALSFDGRYAAFGSNANNLVPNDTNPYGDVFVRDMSAGVTTLASVDDLGQAANQESWAPGICADGRYIAFSSKANNLTPDDHNAYTDIYVRDQSGCRAPLILTQPIGQTVFIGQPFAITVVAGGTDPMSYQWRKDGAAIPGATGSTLNFAAATEQDAGAYDVVVSNACGSVTSDVAIIVVQHCSPVTSYGSVGIVGVQLADYSAGPALSASGRYAAFHTPADNVVPGDAFGYEDVFVYDHDTGQITWISVSAGGEHGNAGSVDPVLSADGRFVLFRSSATNLVPPGAAGLVLCDRDPDGNGTFDEGNTLLARVSVNSNGDPVNGVIGTVFSMSADARFIAFSSDATNLPYSGGGIDQIYVHDRQTGQTTCASLNASGAPGDHDSMSPSISADGRYVAFRSAAANLAPNDPNAEFDIHVHDRQTGATTLVSVNADGVSPNADNNWPFISGDGRAVAFVSQGALVAGDTNGVSDVYVRDVQAGQTTRVSVDSAGVQGNGNCFEPRIAHDGHNVVFYSNASNLVSNDTNGYRDAFAHDRATGETRRISVSSDGAQGNRPTGEAWNNGAIRGLALSADGTYAAYFSLASNLVPFDALDKEEVYRHDLLRHTTERVAVSGPGVTGSGIAARPSLSADGLLVAFQSNAYNLVPGDTNAASDVFCHNRLTGETRRLNVGPHGEQTPEYSFAGNATLSSDGRYVAYYCSSDILVPGDTNGRQDVLVYHLAAGRNVRVSVSSSGAQGNGDSGQGGASEKGLASSGDGRFVAFVSDASNLVPNDTNASRDVFLHDRDPDGNGVFDEGNGVTTRASVNSSGGQAGGWSTDVAISADGRYVAFVSNAMNLVPGDNNNKADVFVHDCQTGATQRISVDSAGQEANDESHWPSLSADGRYVAFHSNASNLDPLVPMHRWAIYVHDRQSGATFVASVNSAGQIANAGSYRPELSADGRFVAFNSAATNLVPNDTNGYADTFVRDLQTGVTQRVSIGAQGQQGNRDAGDHAISGDGGTIAIQTAAWDLIPGVINLGTNIFVHQRSDCYAPRFGEQPGDQSAHPGDSVVFAASAAANPAPAFQWRKDGVPIFGATFHTYTIDRVSTSDTGAYDVVARNELGSITSTPATLTIAAPSCRGDVNCDGKIDFGDIDPFVAVLSGGPCCDGTGANCDVNGDGNIDFGDIDPFVALLSSGATCP